MGSVIDYIECPNCKQEAFSDFYYKTGEEYVICNNCGFHHSQVWKRDSDGKFLTKDGSENYDFENLICETNTLENPYGSYRIKVYQSPATQCGSLENEDQYNELKQSIQEDVEIEFCSVSRFIDGEIKVEVLIDNGPQIDSSGFTHEDNFLL
jgi:Zn ribbon nucleic-acid-binding protein